MLEVDRRRAAGAGRADPAGGRDRRPGPGGGRRPRGALRRTHHPARRCRARARRAGPGPAQLRRRARRHRRPAGAGLAQHRHAVRPRPGAAGAGTLLPVGDLAGEEPFVDVAPVGAPPDRPVLRVLPGPAPDWLDDAAWTALTTQEWPVGSDSDRVGPAADRTAAGPGPGRRAAQRGAGARARCRCRPTAPRCSSSPTTR